MISADLWMLAKKLNNYIEDTGTTDPGNTAWDSTTVQTYKVPADKRWLVIGGGVKRDASQTLLVEVYDVSDQKIQELVEATAATSYVNFFNTSGALPIAASSGLPLILDADEYILITCGGAQGAGAFASCIVLEVDI